MARRWAVHGKAFWIQPLPMDGPWEDHAWPCMVVHGISVRVGTGVQGKYLESN